MICSVEDCQRNVHGQGLCHKHYLQKIRHGKIFEKTRFSDNDIIPDGEISYIVLRDNKGSESARAIIDTDDVEKIKPFKWRLNKKKRVNKDAMYATAGTSPKIALHRLIMAAKDGELVDHRDGDGLNNRKENLRISTVAQNTSNWFYSKAKYRGITFHKPTQKWQAAAYHEGKQYYLGLFETDKEAAEAYNKKVIELKGEFAKINTI